MKTLRVDNYLEIFDTFSLPDDPLDRLVVLQRLEQVISELRYQLELEVAGQAK